MSSSRRALLRGILVLAAGYGVVRLGVSAANRLLATDLEFQPISDPAGFRRLRGGASSAGFDILTGVGPSGGPPGARQVGASLCESLFGDVRPGTVPVASFSDYNCPYCRVLTQRLAAMHEASDGAIRVTWHEWPILGEASVAAARAALAAGRQGAYVAFHERLMRSSFRATPAFLAGLAADLGIDADRMIADMDSAEITAELGKTAALANIFGFVGTPALVVGRTVVQGEIDDYTLERLIALEREEGPPPACA